MEFKNSQISKNYAENEFRNFYVILSTLALTHCTFTDDPSLYTEQQNSLVIGGFIYIADATLNIIDSTFNKGIGNEGGAIFSVLSTVSISGSTFSQNAALKNGGSIFGLINKQITILNTLFSENTGTIGDALNIEQSDSQTIITNTNFTSMKSPSFIHFVSNNANINNCIFEQTAKNDYNVLTTTELSDLRSASAIASEGRGKLTATNSKFKSMLSSYGVILIRETMLPATYSSVQYTFTNNTFESNTAYSSLGGSGIYLVNPLNANISSNTFTSNRAVKGDGGAFKYYCDNSNCHVNLQSNTFSSNYAGTKGGAVSWNLLEPQNILSNTYSGNIAVVYGSNIGSVGENMASITKSEYNANVNTTGDVAAVTRRNLNIVQISDFQSGSSIPTKYIAIVDKLWIYCKIRKCKQY